jgi:hypothetical protein
MGVICSIQEETNLYKILAGRDHLVEQGIDVRITLK